MNEFQRDILEIKFKEERTKNHLMITQKNLEKKLKLKEYENKIKKETLNIIYKIF
jgi:hypothetical protein